VDTDALETPKLIRIGLGLTENTGIEVEVDSESLDLLGDREVT
jgi:hypothetical protein